MHKKIEHIKIIREFLGDISFGPFFKLLETYIDEELEKPENEMDTEFIDYCVNTYNEIYEETQIFLKQEKSLFFV